MIYSKIAVIMGMFLTGLMILFHLGFPKLFNWKAVFEKLSGSNKKILFTIHLALILMFTVLFCISLFHFNEFVNPKGLGKTYLILISLFWIWRTIWQIFYFWPKKNGKFPLMHTILIIVFLLLSASYIIPVIF